MHIKCVELSHFKSFGGTAAVPLLPGFTVISGPNGSGKSNILDALLFALGLASSKGMRADRLPDLVNQSQMGRRSTAEALVTVTFDISDVPPELLIRGDGATPDVDPRAGADPSPEADPGEETALAEPAPQEWQVSRRLRVTKQGTYTSTYYINGEPCTLTELHEQLQRFHVYPEGYNVVLQGDVTSIISMNSRERREIIDELAGVAAFDRKINQAREKLEVVREREERFRIVEKELTLQRDRLAQDRLKAEKYQRLKAEFQSRTQWEAVRLWQAQERQGEALAQQIRQDTATAERLAQEIIALEATLATGRERLDALNQRVKALGEEEHVALQSQLATHEAQLRQWDRQGETLKTEQTQTATQIRQGQLTQQSHRQTLAALEKEITVLSQGELVALRQQVVTAQTALGERRQATQAIAAAAQAWVTEQTQRRRDIETHLDQLEPLRTEQVRLQERVSQLTQQIETLGATVAAVVAEMASLESTPPLAEGGEERIQALAQRVAAAEAALALHQETQQRLLREQRDKQRQLDRLEAQAQALQESQGTQATKILLASDLEGVCGLVAQLGRVEPRFQRALEIAAGARLGYLVVEDDRIAAQGIDLLKRRQGGRATFLPLNKIRVPSFTPLPAWQRPEGFLGYAVDLIDYDDRYQRVFAFVFGGTAVFESLAAARSHLGQLRMVTLEGDLLETSGAMTGGSIASRQGTLHFGTMDAEESPEAQALRHRLAEIDPILARCDREIAAAQTERQTALTALSEARQNHREQERQAQQQQRQRHHWQSQRADAETRLAQAQQELATAQSRLAYLSTHLPPQEEALQAARTALEALEQSQTHQEWQLAQQAVQQLETELGDRQATLQAAERRLQEARLRQERLTRDLQAGEQALATLNQRHQQQTQQRQTLEQQRQALLTQMAQTRQALTALDQTLAAERTQRDEAERHLREQQTQHQQLTWQREKTLETCTAHQQQWTALQGELARQRQALPDPLPEIPDDVDLEGVRQQLRSLQRRIEALEPVNMLALEEYEQTQERLGELTDKLSTLAEERTELLLRIENFTTLRRTAFQEAFEAVNENFKAIFAQLSDGDGYLQLDDPQDPFNGGLNLVAHPKGKPVRRLASMSGGEKSLTALSFIFALQRYRPSPFYAFDEVDMFLDGANVERLSKMIQHQAQQAQFIVVSLRRPMIESAQRTIGVTQARGAYTQVLGISLEPQRASR